jgi:drug/metabolite transporter (DMT)-like permease
VGSPHAGWGAAGGLLLSGVFVAAAFWGENPWEELVGLGPLFALAGAVCAAGSLAVARRAERRALLDARTEPGLPTSEKQKPLGDVD